MTDLCEDQPTQAHQARECRGYVRGTGTEDLIDVRVWLGDVLNPFPSPSSCSNVESLWKKEKG